MHSVSQAEPTLADPTPDPAPGAPGELAPSLSDDQPKQPPDKKPKDKDKDKKDKDKKEPPKKQPPPPPQPLALAPPAPPAPLPALRLSESEPMFGDPMFLVLFTTAGSALPVPSLRGFKIADHESPSPLDRAYVGFNFYDDVSDSINRRIHSVIHDQRVYRETFGIEKTFFDGRASVGLRLPLNTLSGQSADTALNGSSTDVGDLSVILKYAVWRDHECRNLVSVGLAVTTPTGPDSFAGSGVVAPLHTTTLQPYLGYIWNIREFYLHGFSSIDVPTDGRDVTILYDDVGVGYHLYRAPDPCMLITAVVPTFEVHVNTPLNHRGSVRIHDVAGTPDLVDLTLGTYVHFYERARLGFGVAVPVTGPKPFNVEAIAHLELRF
jgi:hypothetical protein